MADNLTPPTSGPDVTAILPSHFYASSSWPRTRPAQTKRSQIGATCTSITDFRSQLAAMNVVSADLKSRVIVFHSDILEQVVGPISAEFDNFLLPCNAEDSLLEEIHGLTDRFKIITAKAEMYATLVDAFSASSPGLNLRGMDNRSRISLHCLPFFRWDGAGVVYTEKLRFSRPEIAIFFRRIAVATLGYQGRDTMVKSLSPVVQSTQCFKAYCKKRDGLVLLKDTWRVILPRLNPEHEIYAKLAESHVPNISGVYHGTDIGLAEDPHHVTRTARLVKELQLELDLRKFHHYRLVIKLMPYGIEDFKTTAELIRILHDAALAHSKAVTDAQVLHGDISVGNIMMKRVGDSVQGYLIDWDLCLDMSLPASSEAQLERTGTWQFVAIRLAEGRLEPNSEPLVHSRIDDVESFYHLTCWLALRYTSHCYESAVVTTVIQQAFDDSYIGNRRSNMESGDMLKNADFSEGMDSVLAAMYKVLRERYLFKKNRYDKDDEEARKEALSCLDDPLWLPRLLEKLLESEDIDWSTNGDKVVHKLDTSSEFATSTRVSSHTKKRKNDSQLDSEGSRKSARRSGKSTLNGGHST